MPINDKLQKWTTVSAIRRMCDLLEPEFGPEVEISPNGVGNLIAHTAAGKWIGFLDLAGDIFVYVIDDRPDADLRKNEQR